MNSLAPAPQTRVTPVSILTGFLGAGKTTLLNHILRGQSEYKFAVIINEVGKIGIDGQLVETQSDEIVEISNGCVCCTVRKDLVSGIQKLLKRGGFDYILIETTGIADPAPIIQTFTNIPTLQHFARIDAVITVVDAEHILGQILETETAIDQVTLADFVLVNKIDLVDEAKLRRIEAQVAKLNPHTRLLRVEHGKVPLGDLLDIHAFDVDHKLGIDAGLLDEMRGSGTHHHDIESFAFEFEQPFRAGRLEQFVEQLSENEKVYRSKGVLSIRGAEHRAVFHGVNNRFELFWDRPWRSDEARRSQLVFIGKKLDAAGIERGLRECLA